MNEIQFLHKNIEKWEELEKLLEGNSDACPDRLSDLYISLTDDLAYSRTFFPGTRTVKYLNQLAQKAHGKIYRTQPTGLKKIRTFWGSEFPVLIYSTRKEIAVSFLIFFISTLIGILSQKYDPRFSRAILGDSYVNMTLANIEKGDALAVYKSMNQAEMFLGISFNNIRVSFFAFVTGVFTALGTGFIILRNGIMLGTFHAFLAQHGLLVDTIATVWIHGTLEIFAIIVAGGAGIVLGNSLVFPGTWSRGQSFRKGAVKGIKMVTGLVPVFIIAGFFEGFITRYTEAPYILRFLIISISLFFILYYFYLYPRKIISKNHHHENANKL